MQKGVWMRFFGVIVFLLLVSRTLWAAGPAAHDFRVTIPDGLYLYNELGPMQGSIWFAPLMLVEKGRLVDPYRIGQSRKGRAKLEKLLKGKAFNAFVGSDLLGRQEEADWGTSAPESLVGKRQLARDISMREEFPGMSFKDVYAKMPMYVEGEYDINFGCPRPLLAPTSFTPSRKIEFLPVTEEDKEKAVEAARSAYLAPSRLREFERELEREGLPRCTFLKDAGSRLDSLLAVDIDNNGKKDFLGVYTIYATGRRPGGGRHCGIQYQMLFVLMDTGKTEVLAANTSTPGSALGGVIDIDGDGILELAVLTEMTAITPGEVEDDYEDGRQLSVFHYDGNGWKTIYRTVPVLGGIH